MIERVFLMNKKTIMLDMDDVITIHGLSNLIEKFLGRRLEVTNDNIYYWQDLLGIKRNPFLNILLHKTYMIM